jgi:hypothetical protein
VVTSKEMEDRRLYTTDINKYEVHGNVIKAVRTTNTFDPATYVRRPIVWAPPMRECYPLLSTEEEKRSKMPHPDDTPYQQAKKAFDNFREYPNGPQKVEDIETIGTRYWEMRLAYEKLSASIERYRLAGGAYLPLRHELSRFIGGDDYDNCDPRQNANCSGWRDVEDIYAKSVCMDSEWEEKE